MRRGPFATQVTLTQRKGEDKALHAKILQKKVYSWLIRLSIYKTIVLHCATKGNSNYMYE